MKSIKHRLLSLLLTLVTVLSLLPTAAFAASNTGSGLKITTNQAYWSTRLLANGTPYSYRPPLVDGKLVYREKIIRIVERELKRTEEYQQRRDEYGNEEYILGCIMVKGDAFPKEVIAHAFVEDMGLELQFRIWRDEPRIRQKQAMWYDLTLFDVEGDFFGKLEQGYSILSVSDLFHCTAWNATEYLADEQNRDKENSCWKGMQRYLNYCKKHGITRNYLVKKEEYDGIDAMKFYDKSAVAKFEKNRKTQDQCR